MGTTLQPISDDPDARQGNIDYFGCIDGFDTEAGLSGWVLNAASPDLPVELELLVDGIAMPGATISHAPRDDLALHFPAHFETAGFRLNPGGWQRFKTLTKIRPEADFTIKIAGTSFILPRTDAIPSLATIIAGTPQPAPALDLFSRLSYLSGRAGKLAEPADGAHKGLIEAICLDDIASRLCWLLGWTTETELFNEPALVLDGQKLPGAIAIATYPRDDVPAGGVGFAGVLLSDWRPHAGSELAVCFGSGGTSHLRGVAGLKRVTKAEFAAHLKAVAGATPGHHWNELTDLLNGPHSWQPDPAPRPDVQASVDRLLVLPGFGCFAAGWAISKLQDLQGFALKFGGIVLPMDPSSLYFRPRPDLKSLFPDGADLLNRAGFCCFFPAEGVDLAGQVLLKLLLARGAAVHAVEPKHLFRLGRSLPLDALLPLYPAIETEQFFPALVKHVRSNFRNAAPALTAFKITPSPAAMIFALAEDRSDCLLALEEITHHAATRIPAGTAIALIAGTSQPHGEIIRALNGLPADLQSRCSLVFTENPETALRILPELLLLLKAERFSFLPARHFLSATGWNEAASILAADRTGLTIFGVYDPETHEDLAESGACFAWSWAAFSNWSLAMPLRLNFLPKRQDFPAAPPPAVLSQAAFVSRRARLSRLESLLETAVNA